MPALGTMSVTILSPSPPGAPLNLALPDSGGASQVVLVVKNPPASSGDIKKHRFDPWVWKIPWKRKWQPLQYSCPENPLDRGTWQATVDGVAKSWTRLSMYTGLTLDPTRSTQPACSLLSPLALPWTVPWGKLGLLLGAPGLYPLCLARPGLPESRHPVS